MQFKPVHKEQRRHPRYRVALTATFFNDRASGLAKVGDISLGGCRIESHAAISPGEIGRLLIDVPGSHPLKVPQAVVRWVLGKECGIEFMHVDAHDQGWINTFVNQPLKESM